MIRRTSEHHIQEERNSQLHLRTLPCSQELLLVPILSQIKKLSPSVSHHPTTSVTGPLHRFHYPRDVLIPAKAAVDRTYEQTSSGDARARTHTHTHTHTRVMLWPSTMERPVQRTSEPGLLKPHESHSICRRSCNYVARQNANRSRGVLKLWSCENRKMGKRK